MRCRVEWATNGPTVAELIVQLEERAAVPGDGEVRHPPDALAKSPDDRADVEELHPAPGRPEVDDGQTSRLRALRFSVRVAALPMLGQWSEEALDQLERRPRPDVLAEVVPSGCQHPPDLRPVRAHRVPRGHQLERPVGKRKRGAVLRLVHLDTPGLQHLARPLCVRRPCLGHTHPPRQHPRLRDHLAAASVDVQGGPDLRESCGQEPGVPPRRAFLGRAAGQPPEPPAGDIRRLRLGHQSSNARIGTSCWAPLSEHDGSPGRTGRRRRGGPS